MTISWSDVRTRKRYIREAKKAPFLDAVFLIHYYNRDVKCWGPPPRPPDIDPSEVFADFDQAQYQRALLLAQRLLSASIAVGAAFFKYPDSKRSYKDELAHFKAINPGFSDSSYSKAVEAGIRNMR